MKEKIKKIWKEIKRILFWIIVFVVWVAIFLIILVYTISPNVDTSDNTYLFIIVLWFVLSLLATIFTYTKRILIKNFFKFFKEWLKENWFKFFLIVAILIYVFTLVYEQYRISKKDKMAVYKYCIEATKSNKSRDRCVEMFQP